MPDPRPAARLPPHSPLRPACQRHPRRQHLPSAPPAGRAGDTARGRGDLRCRGQRAQAALAPVSMLRRSHDYHREVPARLLAALSSGDFHRRDQDRHIMIKIGARQNYKTARLLRRLSTSNDHARPRVTLDSRRVVRSPLHDSDSPELLTQDLATPPAVSSLGGLRTPAPVPAAPPSGGRHPQTFTKTVLTT